MVLRLTLCSSDYSRVILDSLQKKVKWWGEGGGGGGGGGGEELMLFFTSGTQNVWFVANSIYNRLKGEKN